MNSDDSTTPGSTPGDDSITVEAAYTPPESDEQVTTQWTFEGQSPQRAKELVLRDYVPLEARLWRLGLWYGKPEDRPDGGHDASLLD